MIPDGHFTTVNGVVECLETGIDVFYKRLDYRDPVVFVAICKRWGLVVSHSNSWDCYATVRRLNVNSHSSEYVEKAAALCVIDLVKLGIDKHVERTTRR